MGAFEVFSLIALSKQRLALAGVPKWSRIAISLTDSVVSFRSRTAICSFAGPWPSWT
jgi:hypothetical protein